MTEQNPFYASTFAERKAIREGVNSKQVDADDERANVEDKAVKPDASRTKKKP